MTRRNHPITGKPREVVESPKYLSIQGEPVMPRSDGFQGGWGEMDTLQRAAWCVIIGGFIAYWFLHAFYMPWPQALVITVIFTVWVVWVVCIKASTSLMSNEADACYEPQLSDRQYTQNPGGVPFGCRGCKYCRQFVPESSKHCSICDKCVVGFDHHCRWLNTCVGSKNYKPFFLFVSTTVFCILFHVAIGAYVLSQLFSNGDFIRSRERMMYGVDCIPAHAFFIILVMLGELAVVAPLTYLFMFHTRLIIIGKTTWQLIKARRDQQAHNAAEKAAGRLVPQARDTNADMPGLCDPVPATVNRQRPYMVPTAVVGVMPQMTSTVNTARLGAASPSPMNTSRPGMHQHGHTHAHSHAHSHGRAPISNSPAAAR